MNGKLTVFNAVLGTILVILFGFLIRNVHQNAVQTASIKTALLHCPCAKFDK